MKVKLIEPTRYLGSGKLLRGEWLLTPSLTLPHLAALAPSDIEIAIENDFFGEPKYDEPVDLVGITSYTNRALRAYEIADEFRRRGVPVVMGGIHASLAPDEAAEHADTVVVGEAEETWPQFLDDFRRGCAKKRYVAERYAPLANLPPPRFSLLDPSRYMSLRPRGIFRLAPTPLVPIQAGRGCPHNCEYCTVAVFNGRQHRTRPVAEVVAEVRAARARSCFFVDDNIFASPAYARELFEALIPLKIKWAGQATLAAAKDRALIELAARSGCVFLCIGIESLSSKQLRLMRKTHNVVEDYSAHLRAYRRAGIALAATLIFGFDTEDTQAFDESCDFLVRNRVPFTQWFPLAPYPGTALLARLRAEGKVKDERWWLRRDLARRFGPLVFPGGEAAEETFRERFLRAWKRVYSWRNIARRILLPPGKQWPIEILFNLALRRGLGCETSLFDS
ncbi:MAG: B12-binding domain-containing radical SAM protein [Planctomycetes bacterium]|nr:B12-binding domain-containing radical SAM protein [Planctomycetota bacterium]